MARPKKFRKVCTEPKYSIYVPKPRCYDISEELETVTLTVEEFEVIRLIDNRNLDQVETAEKMEIARSTVQRMYKEAREKLADVVVNGKALKIEGGQYRLCEDRLFVDVCPDCPARIRERRNQQQK